MNASAITHDVDASEVREDGDEVRPVLPIGWVISDKYVIRRVLGSGASGTVYEAEHADIGHRVAIKIVHPSLGATAEILARFRREARICGSLRHPNVGQVYDVGTLEDGSPYMVMELQVGRSLADIFDEMRLSIAATLDIARQLLAGVQAAHAAGVVHRDVKPGNVMVVRDANGEIVVKLVDFGICKQLDAQREHNVTQRGMIVGSPDYMAPEQLRGEDVDPRSDLYGVGALLYEAITGLTPFDRPTLADLLVSILHDRVEPPTVYRPDCPAELELVVLAAMSRDREGRPPSAEQMSFALAQVPRGEHAGTRDPGASLAELSELLRLAGPTGTLTARAADLSTQEIGVALRKPQLSRRLALIGAAVTAVSLPVWIAAGEVTRDRAVVSSAAPTPLRSTAPRPPAVLAPPEALISTSAMPTGESLERAAHTRSSAKPQIAPAKAPTTAAATNDDDIRAAQALLKAATTAFVRGQAAMARELYLQVLARDPRRAEAFRGLGLALNRLGRSAEAARAFERYLQQRPTAQDAPRIRELLTRTQPAP